MRCADCVRLRSRSTTISFVAVPCLALIRCVGGRSLCPAWNKRPPALSFQQVVRKFISCNSKRLVCVSAFSPPAAACPPPLSGPMLAEML